MDYFERLSQICSAWKPEGAGGFYKHADFIARRTFEILRQSLGLIESK